MTRRTTTTTATASTRGKVDDGGPTRGERFGRVAKAERERERASEGAEGPEERERERKRGRSAAIGIINDRNRTKMRTGRVRRRR